MVRKSVSRIEGAKTVLRLKFVDGYRIPEAYTEGSVGGGGNTPNNDIYMTPAVGDNFPGNDVSMLGLRTNDTTR